MTKLASLLSISQQVDWPSRRLPRPKLAVLGPYDAGSRFSDASTLATLQLRGWIGVDRVLPLRLSPKP